MSPLTLHFVLVLFAIFQNVTFLPNSFKLSLKSRPFSFQISQDDDFSLITCLWVFVQKVCFDNFHEIGSQRMLSCLSPFFQRVCFLWPSSSVKKCDFLKKIPSDDRYLAFWFQFSKHLSINIKL